MYSFKAYAHKVCQALMYVFRLLCKGLTLHGLLDTFAYLGLDNSPYGVKLQMAYVRETTISVNGAFVAITGT